MSRPPASPRGTRVVVLVGTQKGLFRLVSDRERRQWTMAGPAIAGYEILHTRFDPMRPRVVHAAAWHLIWGAHIYRSDNAGVDWTSLSEVPRHPPDASAEGLRSIWYLATGPAAQPGLLYAGIDPAGLFVSRDAGGSWQPVTSLNEHPTRNTWEPAKGGFSVHSITCSQSVPGRLYAAVSAGGAYRSDDNGTSWYPINNGVRAENLPDRYASSGHNIHRLLVHPADPSRLYRQCYSGVYRSDDGGLHWTEITAGLPSDFGYAIVSEPDDPDSVYVVPIDSNHLRTTPEGRLRVYRSGDGGRHWRALTHGLPQAHAYITVLREAMDVDSLPDCGVYFGTSSGHLFASADRGQHWQCIAEFLPRILSVKARVIQDHE
ncbi:MAG: hypothetical protein WED00_10120 [Aquisalimonadaceae bacterium]